jgi:hypothetical protein
MAWSNISKPTTSFSSVLAPSLLVFLLLESGAFLLTEGNGKYIISSEGYKTVSKPTTSYNNVSKP